MFLGEILCTFCKMINTKNVLTYKLKLCNDADLQGNSAQGSIIVMVLIKRKYDYTSYHCILYQQNV